MIKYAHLYEISPDVKERIEDDCSAHVTPLSYNEVPVKRSILKALQLDVEPNKVIMGTKVEANGGRTLLVLSDEELDGFVEVQYRYQPDRSHTLADWLFYLEDLCEAYQVPRKQVE